jgi:hypothetical protein
MWNNLQYKIFTEQLFVPKTNHLWLLNVLCCEQSRLVINVKHSQNNFLCWRFIIVKHLLNNFLFEHSSLNVLCWRIFNVKHPLNTFLCWRFIIVKHSLNNFLCWRLIIQCFMLKISHWMFYYWGLESLTSIFSFTFIYRNKLPYMIID